MVLRSHGAARREDGMDGQGVDELEQRIKALEEQMDQLLRLLAFSGGILSDRALSMATECAASRL